MADEMIKSVDIVIPSYEPGESFTAELRALGAQTYPYSRLIVIHTLKGDDADEKERVRKLILGEVPEDRLILRYIDKADFDHGSARMEAVGLSSADAFICMTCDAVPAGRYFIERLMEALCRDGRIAVAYARQIARDDASEAERFAREFNYPARSMIKGAKDLDKLGIKTYFSSNVAAAYRRSVFDELGGFPRPAVFNEDMIYAARAVSAGYMIYYKADAEVYHSHNLSAVSAMRRSFDNGMSQAMHPEVFGELSSESEGLRYVRRGVRDLSVSGHLGEVPGFIWVSGLKFIGFRLGKAFRKLPAGLAVRLSSDPELAQRVIRGEDV